jgi:hypothetical protein
MDSIQKNNIIVPKLNLNLEAKYSEAFWIPINYVSFKITKDKIYWLQ